MYSSTNLFPATSSPPKPVRRAAHWFQTSTRPSLSIPKIGAFALRVFFFVSCLCVCYTRYQPRSWRAGASRNCLCTCTRRVDSRVIMKTAASRRRHRRDHATFKFSEDAGTRVSINLELSLSWMFRAKRRRPVGGDVAPRRARNLATPSFTNEGNSSIAPASQHRKQTSASARDKGDDDTSPSSSQAARNLLIVSNDAWDCPAHLYSPEAFASTEHFRASSVERDARAVPSPSSSKVAARRDARVVRARLRGWGEAIGPEGLSSTRRAVGYRTLQL